jgi:hypothetical protein
MTATDEARQPVTRAGRVFCIVALHRSGSGALQMYRVRGGLLTEYGADVFGTAWLYAITRSGRTILQRGRTVSAGSAATIVFVLCVISEFGQKLHFVSGHYDPYDIAAYATSVVACWMIDYQVPFIRER